MSRRPSVGHIQGPQTHSLGEREYQRLQQIILDEKGVACSVLVTPQYVSIRAASKADYYLAKSAIRGRVSVDIVQGWAGNLKINKNKSCNEKRNRFKSSHGRTNLD